MEFTAKMTKRGVINIPKVNRQALGVSGGEILVLRVVRVIREDKHGTSVTDVGDSQ